MTSEGSRHTLILDLPPALPAEFPEPEEMRKAALFLLDTLSHSSGFPETLELSLTILDDEEMREINRDHRKKDRPTDVLSFPQVEFPSPGNWRDEGGGDPDEDFPIASFVVPGETSLLGDILISYDTCVRQAHEIGHSVTDEFLRLLVHGLLHLFGYDHERSPEEEHIMKEREDELLTLLAAEGL